VVSEMNINSILIALKNGGPGNALTSNHRGDALASGQPDQAIEAGGIRVIVRTICWMSGSRRDDGALWSGPKIARWLAKFHGIPIGPIALGYSTSNRDRANCNRGVLQFG
jgi:hypothetical protein